MDKLREAASLALEALERLVGWMDSRDMVVAGAEREAITALREQLAQAQGEWVDLTSKEINEVWCSGINYEAAVNAVIAKFKSKNTPPVVPQREPVACSKDAPVHIYLQTGCDDEDCECAFNEWGDVTWCGEKIHDSDIHYVRADNTQPSSPNLNCKSVQRRLATSWGYVRKEEYDMARVAAASQMRDTCIEVCDKVLGENNISKAIATLPIPKIQWRDLTTTEIHDCYSGEFGISINELDFARAVIAKFKEKNTPPVVQQGEPVAWQPIETLKPTAEELDILMGDGSVLCNVLTQADGDLWWGGSGTGEKFIDPKHADVTHWRKHSDTTPFTKEQK